MPAKGDVHVTLHVCTTEPAAAEVDVTRLCTPFLLRAPWQHHCRPPLLQHQLMWLLVLLPYPGTADQPPTLPVALQAMQQPEHVTELQVPMAARVAWLNCQYTHFHQHPGKGELLRKLQKLRKIIGGKVRRGARPARHCSQLDASPCQVCIISFLHGALARHRCITGCLLWPIPVTVQSAN